MSCSTAHVKWSGLLKQACRQFRTQDGRERRTAPLNRPQQDDRRPHVGVARAGHDMKTRTSLTLAK
eukprot:8255613-Alexandrium_andersonii.AAC.1